MEDKVKEQLEAANPEPIIEEVVGTLVKSVFFESVSLVCDSLLLFCVHTGFGQPGPEET